MSSGRVRLGWSEVPPVPSSTFWPFHVPYAGGFLGTRSGTRSAFHGLRRVIGGSAPSGPPKTKRGTPNDAADFT